jgi:hypothetical protein
VDSCAARDEKTSTLNILLVIGRDTSQNPLTYDDVNPFLATDALVKIQNSLGDVRSPVELNIEIVRPSTLEAFAEHLQRAEDTHGPGYFHLVHFDMHGEVRARPGGGTKHGFLYFSDPSSDGTVAIPGSIVSPILKRHNVHFAVLNSCESARASLGDDANIAMGFIKDGVLGVLGMSFKVGSGAATLFLDAFYRGFLVDGESFSHSAATGRAALRLNPSRMARYGLQREMNDSFVAVAYGPNLDLFLAQPTSRTRRRFMRSGGPKSSAQSTPALAFDASPVVGRDFDLLRLEKQLVHSRVIFLHGAAGVGKTTFLLHAASLWRSTNFVNAVVNVDVARDSVLSAEDLYVSVLSQLLLQVSFQEHSSRLWSMPSRSLRSYDLNMIEGTIAGNIALINVVIVLDGLQTPLSAAPEQLTPGALHGAARSQILQCIGFLTRLAQHPTTTKRCYLILVTRPGSPSWFESLSKDQPGFRRYELKGLSLPDAIDLSHRVLGAAGIDVQQWGKVDADWLESIVDLLQGNPSALSSILPLQQASDIGWRAFYPHLHRGPFGSLEDLKRSRVASSRQVQDIYRLLDVLRPGHCFFLCLLSNYWHYSVYVEGLLYMFMEIADEPLKRDLRMGGDGADNSLAWGQNLVAVAIDQGFARIDQTNTCLWIHPLLTIVGRVFLAQSVPSSKIQKLRTAYCNLLSHLSLVPTEEGPSPVLGFANILTSVEHCLSGVPLGDWPVIPIGAYTLRNYGSSSSPTLPLFRKRLFRLLGMFAEMPPSTETEWKSGLKFFVYTLMSASVTGKANSAETWGRVSELSTRGLSLVLLLDGRDDGTSADSPTLWKGLLHLSSYLSSHGLGKRLEAKASWEALKSIKGNLSNEINPEIRSQLDAAFQVLASGNLHELNDLSQAMARLLPVADSIQGLDLFRIVFSFLYLGIERKESAIPSEDSGAGPESSSSRPTRKRDTQIETISEQRSDVSIEQYKAILGFDSRHAPPHPLADVRASRKDLDALEAAYDTGDMSEVSEKHVRLATRALQMGQFEEVQGHLASLRKIAEDEGYPNDSRGTIDELEKSIKRVHISYLTQVSMSSSGPEPRREADGVQRPMNLISPNGGASAIQEALRIRSEWQEPRKWWDWWHTGRGQDARWLQRVYGSGAEYAEEVELLAQVHGAWIARDWEAALLALDRLEPLCSESLFVRYRPDASSLQDARICLELICVQTRLMRECFEAMTRDDFEGAVARIEELSRWVRPKFFFRLTDEMIEMCRKVSERERLLMFTLNLHKLGTSGQYERYQKLYRDFVGLIEGGAFLRIPPSELLNIRCQALAWLMEHAVDAELWQEGLLYSEELLALTQPWLKERPRAQDACLNARETCEQGLLLNSLTDAENMRDFKTCLRLLDALEAAYEKQKLTHGRARSRFFLLGGPGKLRFWRGAYRDRCVSCARWIQKKTNERCRLKNGRGPNHNREVFRRPFGCSCHCEGGFCFNVFND